MKLLPLLLIMFTMVISTVLIVYGIVYLGGSPP